MRRALLATSAIVAFALGTYACGSDDSDTPVPSGTDAGKTSSSSSGNASSSSGNGSSSSGSTTSSSGSTTSSSGSTTSSSGSTSGNTSSGGTPPVADSGTVGDAASIPDAGPPDANEADGAAGTLCQAGSTQESEVNDAEGTADVLSSDGGTFCGTASTTDTDFITFTLPVDASAMSIAVNATDAIKVEGSVDGKDFVIAGAGATGTFPFAPGGKYVIKATSTAAKSDYILAYSVTHSPASSKCEATSTKETEDNATAPNTMALTGNASSFCGTINTATDIDKFQFTLPEATKTFSFDYATTGSNFVLKLDVDGKSYTLSSGPVTVDLVKGKPYVLTATSTTPNNGYVFHLNTTQ